MDSGREWNLIFGGNWLRPYLPSTNEKITSYDNMLFSANIKLN